MTTDLTALLTLALVLSGVVNRAVEFVKSALNNTPFYAQLDAEAQKWILQAVAWLCGVVAAVAAGFNILALVPAAADVPAWVGYVASGFALSLGSDGLHIALDILYATRDHQAAKAFAVNEEVLNGQPPLARIETDWTAQG